MKTTSKLKQSETIIIKRSQIHFAAYNPRKRNSKVVEELKRNFRRVGFLGGIQWNPTTGNLIGGHKRLEALDLIHGYDGATEKDYDVKVESIALDEKTEKEQNIFLNNRRAQGETDYELLAEMIKDIDVANAAIDEHDLEIINSIVPDFDFGSNDDIKIDMAELKGHKTDEEKKSHVKDMKKKIKSSISEGQQSPYFVVTFADAFEKAGYLEGIGISGDQIYIKSDEFIKRISE